MASYGKAKLRSVLAFALRLLLFIQAYLSVFAGLFSSVAFLQASSSEAKSNKNATKILMEAAQAEKELGEIFIQTKSWQIRVELASKIRTGTRTFQGSNFLHFLNNRNCSLHLEKLEFYLEKP